ATAEGTGVFIDYSPSVSRSRIVELQTGKVIETLSSITDAAAHNINPTITSGSSIAKTLAVRGKYDPTGIIMEALHARAQAQPLRNYLHHVLHTNDVERDYSEIMGTIGRLRSLVDRD